MPLFSRAAPIATSMAVVRPEAIDLHPKGRNEMEGGRQRLSWTARNGAQRQGKKVEDGRCRDKIESPQSGIALRSDQPLSRTQMGAPVAKTHGMKTDGPMRHSDQGNERRSGTSFTVSRPHKSRVITYQGNYRCQQRRRTCRSGHRKIDNEAAHVLAMRMQPGPPHPCDRHAARRETDASVGGRRPPSPTIPPARAMGRSSACRLQGRTALVRVVSTIDVNSRSGCRARFRFERYLAGGRSGLSAHFRAAGSRSGSSSQARQT